MHHSRDFDLNVWVGFSGVDLKTPFYKVKGCICDCENGVLFTKSRGVFTLAGMNDVPRVCHTHTHTLTALTETHTGLDHRVVFCVNQL